MAGQLGDAFRKALERLRDPGGRKAAAASPSTPGKNPREENDGKAPARKKDTDTARLGVTFEPEARVRWIGEFTENPAFSNGRQWKFERTVPSRDGVSTDLLEGRGPRNEADVCLGIDFGTSTVKAVVRDLTRAQGYAVRFSREQEDRYLLPTGVFESSAGYSLDPGGIRQEDLKLSLMQPAEQVGSGHLENACAFLALVIRHCRGWFLSEYGPVYRDHLLNWYINIGLPARSYEESHLVERFQKVAWAAANLASDPAHEEITRSATASWLKRWSATTTGNLPEPAFHSQDVMVIPEIAAQIAGMVQARSWDVLHRPYFILVDVGAGTLDTAFFAVLNGRDGAPRRFVFYSSDVRPLGVINLHRARARWLLSALGTQQPRPKDAMDYLGRIDRMAYGYREVPDDVRTYLGGASIEPLKGTETIDDRIFHHGALAQVCGCMGDGKSRHGLNRDALQALPLVISGGGSRMQFYSRLSDAVNDAWRRKWLGAMSVQKEQLVLPSDFEARGLSTTDHDRLSVAYGLSLRNVWEIIRPDDIPPAPPPPQWRGTHFVSKEDV